MRSIVTTAILVLAMAAAAFAGVNISSPSNGSTVTSPTRFVASASSGNPITAMRIYVDNVSVYTVRSASLDTYVSMSQGKHYVVVQAWDSAGGVFKSAMNLTVSGSSGAVNVSAPGNGATVQSPVPITATASSRYPISAMRVYVDNNAVFTVPGGNLNTAIPMSAGAHYVVVQAWDVSGAVFKSPMTLNVTTSSSNDTGAPPVPSDATTLSNIDQMGGWEHCTTCAGAAGNGPTAQYSMTQGISSPSLDGNAIQFFLGGSIPYSNALWWKQLGANRNATHFVYELYFYVQNPQYVQALEFDVNQSVGGYKYIFGTQCAPRGSGQWDVWDGTAETWRPTGIACSVPTANTWHHLVQEFQRDSSGNVTYVAITLDGVRHVVNHTYGSLPSRVNEINVAFQMDGDYAQHDYSTWVDRVKLTYW